MRSSTVGESNSYIRPSQDASSQYLHSSNVNSGGHLQSHFITAYAKEAEESIKSAVGVSNAAKFLLRNNLNLLRNWLMYT